MFNVVFVNPEIPPNTGNIIRQCALTGASLHLVEPIAFDMSDKRLQRAGLDYHEYASVQRYADWDALQAADGFDRDRCFLFESQATTHYHTVEYQPGDWLVFGNEALGLPSSIMDRFPHEQLLRLPMVPNRRSHNVANTVGIAVYEAWRQLGFSGGQ